MEKDDKRFSREEIEAQTERSHSQLPQEEHRLVQDLYTLSQDYARENDRSFERVWSRLLQVQQSSPEPLQHSQDASEHKVLPMKGKGMHPNDSQWETVSSTLRSHGAKPHKSPSRPFKRLLGVGLCAAILTLVVGWALIFSGLHTNPQAPSSRVGSSNVQSTPKPTPRSTLQSSVSSDPRCSFTAHGPQHLNYNTDHS
ncbi:MAG TPA: hypothetical protein VFN35_22630, partial [Ktedonobacteraceae bacterium]|nr:hypothetical protein [Ktedonobacteraceae bacterium]